MNPWQILDVGSIWMKEFACALSGMERVVAWSPRMENLGAFHAWQCSEHLTSPPLEVHHFPLQRGYSRYPIRWIAPYQAKMVARMKAMTLQPRSTPLICSTPFYAPVAELWPGPVIYYVTDLTVAYPGLNPRQVRSLDRRMCRVARAICPNSKRIAEYLRTEAWCDPGKITVIPNATRRSNIAARPQYEPGPLPEDVQDLPRPIAGVLGDLSGNMDWTLLAETIRRTPGISWLFVGPSTRAIADATQNAAREWVKAHARFTGPKPYGDLQGYARCLDAAVLPYRRNEPTYSGSSTRFYEHLAACRPIIATRGFAELLEKEPLLTLIDTAEQLASVLSSLQARSFHDGQEIARWDASKRGTWEERARRIRTVLKLGTSAPSLLKAGERVAELA